MTTSPPNPLFVQRLWKWLIAPVRSTADTTMPSGAKLANRVELLSLLLLMYIGAMLAGLLSALMWFGDSARPVFLAVFSAALIGAYALNRFGYFYTAARLFIWFLLLTPYILLLTDTLYDKTRTLMVLMGPIFAMIVAYLLLSLSAVARLTLTSLAAIVVLPLIRPTIPGADLVIPFCLNVLGGTLMVVAAIVHRHEERVLTVNQNALAESEARFRDFFELTFEPTLIHDDGVIIDVNPALASLLGTTVTDMIGQTVWSYIHPDDRALAAKQVQQDLENIYEIRLIRADRQVIPVEVRGMSRTYRGKTLRIASVRDISDTRRAEAHQIELVVEREKVNVLQRFIGNMSHDLRTPLTVIKTSVYLLKRLKDDTALQKQQLEVLEGQVEHLQRLFDDLLSMSKLDKADTSDYRFKWIDVNKPTRQAVDDEHRLALRRKQTLQFIPTEGLPQALLDEYEYKRMIKHLILNGLGYTPEGGTVTVRTYAENGEIYITVQDTGQGISPLELPHIFERFYRRDNLQNSPDGGTGLGLNIARKIAEAHGGMIDVVSEVGAGSTFRVRLPILSETEALMLMSQRSSEGHE